MKITDTLKLYLKKWPVLWMRFAGHDRFGRFSMRMAALFMDPYKDRIPLSFMNESGFIEASAIINHKHFNLGKHCFIGDRVIINERKQGEKIEFGDRVEILRDTILETGMGGQITIGNVTSIHPGCSVYSYLEPIIIGSGVMIAPGCALYSYDHNLSPERAIRNQLPRSKGPLVIGDESWIGFGSIVLNGVRVGKGSAIGAGSVVVNDIPDYAIAVGNPASVIKYRSELGN